MLMEPKWIVTGNGNRLSTEQNDDGYTLVVDVTEAGTCYLVHSRKTGSFVEAPEIPSIVIDGDGWIVFDFADEAASPAVESPRFESGVAIYGSGPEGQPSKTVHKLINAEPYRISTSNGSRCSVFFRFTEPGQYRINSPKIRWFSASQYEDLQITRTISHSLTSIRNADLVELEIDLITKNESNTLSLLTVCWFDEFGNEIAAIPEYAINTKLGPYQYINPGVHSYAFTVPDSAESGSVSIRHWKGNSAVLVSKHSETVLKQTVKPAGEFHEYSLPQVVDSIPLDEPLIVLHTTAPPLGHETLSLRPNRLAIEFQALGAHVIFLPFSKVDGLVEKFEERSWVVCRSQWPKLQQLLADREGIADTFVCSSFPNYEALAAIDLLQDTGWTTVYEIRDDMEEFNRVGYSKWFDNQLEMYVLQRVDHVVTVSPRLAEKAEVISGRNDVLVVPNAVSDYLLEKGKEFRTAEAQARKDKSNVVGYLGHLTESWFDWSLLLQVARELPEIDFRIIGHGMPKKFLGSLPNNVNFLGPMSHAEFVIEAAEWRTGLIPFKLSPLTFGVDPNKLYEYLALGLRVVSAPMGGVGSAPWTRTYRTVSEFREMILLSMRTDTTSQDIQDLQEYLETAGWRDRAIQMLRIFSGKNSNEN